jgi:GH15 family glucan-1,4-alpha-glucosidase
VLLIPEVGFLPADDPRVVGTVDLIRSELTVDGLVRRYELASGASDVDGLSGSEGAFLACSFWMVNALHLTGKQDDAQELFERLLSLRNDVGLLSEEYDPRYRRQVGNTPQAFSHVPLVQAAVNLAAHQTRHSRRPARHGGHGRR